MSRRKRNNILLPWMSAKPDCRELRFLQVGNSLLLSPEFKTLSSGARLLYLCMGMEAGGKKGFQFPRSAQHKYGFDECTAARYIRELISAGFVRLVSSGRIVRQPNLYEFPPRRKDAPSPGETETQKETDGVAISCRSASF